MMMMMTKMMALKHRGVKQLDQGYPAHEGRRHNLNSNGTAPEPIQRVPPRGVVPGFLCSLLPIFTIKLPY